MFNGNVMMDAHSASKKESIISPIAFNIYDDMNIGKTHVNVTEEEDRCAEALLREELVKGDKFIASGHRNDTAVNMCIALHVLGIYGIEQWFNEFFDKFDNRFDNREIDYFMDHVCRVLNYIDVWGPEGSEGEALGYTL